LVYRGGRRISVVSRNLVLFERVEKGSQGEMARKRLCLMSDGGFEGTSSDMATLYRTLRQLEDDGMVLSEWEEGSQGPKKRVYELTEDGLILLENWALVIKENRDRLARFLVKYEQ
jgi:DNA-binding PadR family transcriptional regulator